MSDSSSASQKSVRSGRLRLLLIALVIALPVAAGGLFAWLQQRSAGDRQLVERNALGLDLARPDVLIESQSLSRLPRDLLAVPLLRDTLTEDFVFYYEQNADRLGLAGSLRRIVYEHDLEWRDTLLDELLDQPAQVALWRDAGGRLRHFLVAIERGGLARLLEPVAKLALNDSQLSVAGELNVDGIAVPLYRLRYQNQRSVLFASHGDRLLVASSADMLFAEMPAKASSSEDDSAPLAQVSAETAESLLGGGQPFDARFGLAPREGLAHRIALGSEYLALGYQRFIPSFAGLRFEMDGGGWRSFLALHEVDGQPVFDFAPVWRAMPMGASACVALPAAPAMAERLLDRVGAGPEVAKRLSAQLSGTAGLCWYAESRLHSPLLVGQLTAAPDEQTDADIGTLFGSVIGAWESFAENGSFPVQEEEQGDLHSWRREVSSNFGQYPAEQAEHADAMAARGFFRVSLARRGQTLLFSLDDQLVDKALATLDKRFPPLAEVLPGDALVPAFLAPEALAALLERETLDSLPKDMEPVFRNAAETHLLPKLRALAGHKRYALALPQTEQADGRWQWLPLEWRAL
ncbi:DUF2138 domain-containing protein [Pseudomonas sp. PIC25]|uniref:DUF2138 domain-containing protein n=1 Tax=Pseudomonas sp. PIC25 TaxID=1958773 RepID=UPI000BABD524|nr:DUF2138 domain-containing protein [Pseudomonas sp. PIC25]PAU64437.1 DUF2138 domain-containing protein [Pseudomonas sp. PIC25]